MVTTDTRASPRLYSRHLRHGKSARLRYSAQAQAFLIGQGTRLGASGDVPLQVVQASIGASGVLTFVANPLNTNFITVGGITYTFVTSITGASGQVLLGTGASGEYATIQDLIDAINGAGASGIEYSGDTAVNTIVSAAAHGASGITVTAKMAGATGNQFVLGASGGVETWSGGTLQGGTGGGSTGVPIGYLYAPLHPFKDLEGPVYFSGSVPGGFAPGVFYWVHVVNPNCIRLALTKEEAKLGIFIAPSDSTGHVFDLVRPVTEGGVYDLLFRNTADQIRQSTNVDNLS